MTLEKQTGGRITMVCTIEQASFPRQFKECQKEWVSVESLKNATLDEVREAVPSFTRFIEEYDKLQERALEDERGYYDLKRNEWAQQLEIIKDNCISRITADELEKVIKEMKK